MMASGKNTGRPRGRAPVVSKRQGLPWVTIGAVVVVLVLAGSIFAVVLTKNNENKAQADALAAWVPSASNPDPSVNIPGIYVGAAVPAAGDTPATYPEYKAALHITSDQRVAYNRFPPVGGPHDGIWANCNGVVYQTAVRNENMVHTLEHGAVWITYNPDTIAAGDLDVLKGLVDGQSYMSLSPYPGLDSPIALQAWAHQLKVNSATDERVQQFITALRQNRWVYPETGATCQQPSFDTTNPPAFDPSAPGADAVQMDGQGATAATSEMNGASATESAESSAGVPGVPATDTGGTTDPAVGSTDAVPTPAASAPAAG